MRLKYLNKLIFLALSISVLNKANAQPSTSQNYTVANGVKQAGITTEAAVNNLTISTQGKVQTITYYDGLGRPIENVVTNGSASQKDIITGMEYDQFGREVTKYLPFSDVNNLGTGASFRPTWKPSQVAFYNGQLQGVDADAAPWSVSALESSPLNRTLAQGAPGTVWQPNMTTPYDPTTHSVQIQYPVNTVSDNIRIFYVDASNNITSPGNYPAGQIYVKLTADEQGQQVKEFTDKSGHVVLKRVYLATDSMQTYYIYNDLDLLAAVIQPQGVSTIANSGSWSPTTTFAGQFMFLYRYDQRNRIVAKKIPGADSVLMVYDQWDRVVLTQDGNLRTQSTNNWLFTKYDQLDRPIVTGLLTDTRTQSAIRTDVASNSGRYESVNTAVQEGYTLNNSYPSSSTYTLTVNTIAHYDSYANIPSVWSSGYAYVNEDGVTAQNMFLQGQVVATQTKIIGTTNYMRTATYFDDKYRATQSTADNAAGGKDRVTKILSFDGKALNTYHNHTSRFYTTPLLIQETYTYDHVDRLLQVTHQTAAQEVVTLVQNAYNETGQLLNKKLHQSPSHPNYLQKLDYNYNIRGWLNAINRPLSTETGYDESDLFSMDINYNNVFLNQGDYLPTPQYNGNISEIVWKGGYDEYVKDFHYAYDKANRLDSSLYQWYKPNQWGGSWDFSRKYDEYLQYDYNGNILELDRFHGDWNGINSLHYANYNGNQIGRVDDYTATPAPFGFHDQVLMVGGYKQNDYTYDANGNKITDYNKGITATTYNFLNLPTLITIPGKGTVAFTYDASGNKLQRTLIDQTVTPNKVTNYYYAGDFVYRNDTLELISHEEGRLRPLRIDTTQAISITNLKYIYDYYLKDHLGSVRSILSTEQETDSYMATMEPAAATVENQLFANVSSTVQTKPAGFDTDNTNTEVSQLNGNINVTTNKRVGPSIVLRVMAGDTISVGTYGWYLPGTAQPAQTGVTPIANDLLPILLGGMLSTNAAEGGAISSSTISSSLGSDLNTFLTTNQPAVYNTNQPKAFLNWMVVDDEFLPVGSPNHTGALQIPSITGTMQKQAMVGPANMVVRRNGWLYVYLSNESPQNVYFDNLAVVQKRGPLVEQKDYYSFGMEIPGLSAQAAKPPTYNKNRYEFNGIEHDTAYGLDSYDAHFRNLDPETGVWWEIDPESEKERESFSPYVSMSDDPVFKTDPLGNEDDECCKEIWDAIKTTVTSGIKNAQENNQKALILVTQVVVNGIAKTENDIKEGNTVPQRIARDAVDNPLSLVDGAEEFNLAKDIFEGNSLAKTVQKYEVGTFDALKGKSVAGDGLDIHHVSQSQPASQVIKNYDKATAPSIALPNAEHKAIPVLKGKTTAGNARQQLAKDIQDLRKHTNAPNKSLEKLIDLNKKKYPQSFKKL